MNFVFASSFVHLLPAMFMNDAQAYSRGNIIDCWSVITCAAAASSKGCTMNFVPLLLVHFV
jgi:hypothetical protein